MPWKSARAVAAAVSLWAAAPFAAGAASPALKVMVDASDLFAVTHAEIAAGLGWTEAQVAAAAAAGTLAMRCGDETVAYLPDDGANRILFHGWPAASPYTRWNAFWIEPGPGLHIQRVAPDPVPVSSNLTFLSTVRRKEELYLQPSMFSSLPGNLYRWMTFSSNPSASANREFSAPLEGYAGGDVGLTVRVTGFYLGAQACRAEIRFNHSGLLGAVEFYGPVDATAQATVPAAEVLPSGNLLRIRGVYIGGPGNSLFVNDWFETVYSRHYEPAAGLLLASDGGHARLTAARFAQPVVFDVTDPHRPRWIARADGSLPAGDSWGVTAGSEWAFRERAGIPVRSPVAAGRGGWLRSASNAVDYLVIAPRDFEGPAQALAQYRESLGLRAAVAFYEDLCDEFAAGLNTPEAIRGLLAHARQHWAAPPWMVVLGGGGHYDFGNRLTVEANRLPPLLAGDGLYLRPADGLLADLDGDEVPDLAIGRIPAQTAAQFSAYIAKLQAYEANPDPWPGRIQFIAGATDSGGDYTAINEAHSAAAAGRYGEILKATRETETASQIKGRVIAAFNEGASILHYSGHGGPFHWGSDYDSPKLLANADVQNLNHRPIPLVMMQTCNSGRFDTFLDNNRCLAERLVLRETGGSLAVYAASGESYNFIAGPLFEEFYRLHAAEGIDTVGAGLLRARQAMGPLGGAFSAGIRTYNLLGDPALKILGADSAPPAFWITRYAHWRWERFTHLELADPEVSGELADPSGNGWGNFLDYAFGNSRPGLEPGGVEEWGGGPVVPLGGRSGESPGYDRALVVRWLQRKTASDLEYLVWTTDDLVGDWEPAPPGMMLEFTDLPGGVMEQVEARVPFESDRLFLRMEVRRR